MNYKLTIDSLLIIDDNGMPKPPTLRPLIDRDIRELFIRDKTPDKKKYIAEAIVIYYLGDPKSPARQAGLSDPEALKMAIEQAGLENNYIPDKLVLRLITRYYDENITEAGKVVENIIKGIHNINLVNFLLFLKNLKRLNRILCMKKKLNFLVVAEQYFLLWMLKIIYNI